MEVKSYDNLEKRVVVILNNGEKLMSDWFQDLSSPIENSINCTQTEKDVLNDILQKAGLSMDDVLRFQIHGKKEENEIYISNHAFQRLKERLGWSRQTAIRMVKKIYNNKDFQLDPNDKSFNLFDYIDGMKSSEYFLYGNYIYIFERNTLVTVILAKKRALKRKVTELPKPHRNITDNNVYNQIMFREAFVEV